MKKVLLISICCALLIGQSCKKNTAAGSVAGTWYVTITYYMLNPNYYGDSCNLVVNYVEKEEAIVTQVNDNTVNITINGTTTQETINGTTLDQSVSSLGVNGYNGNPNDIIEWTLTGNNSLTGIIKNNPCGEFSVQATKI